MRAIISNNFIFLEEGMISKGKTMAEPEEVSYDGTRLEVLNAHWQRLMNEGIIQSVNYCLSRNGKVFANTAIGKKCYKMEDKRPLETDSIHFIASISKIFCATAIFKLCEDGFLRPLQPVSDILEEFKEAPFDAINISHLLTHTSGMHPDEWCFPYKYPQYWDFASLTNEGESWVANGLKAGIFNKPGKEWAYCSFGFTLLGEIIHRVTGMNAETYIRKVILEPCGMSSSGFINEFARGELPEDFVKDFSSRLYIQNDGSEKFLEELKNYVPGKWYESLGGDDKLWFSVPGTAGGMFSTVEDLNKFGRMLLNGGKNDDGKRVIGRKAIERMTMNYTPEDIKDFCWGAGGNYRMYALGPDTRWNADSHFSKGSFFHEGAGACCLLVDPVEKMVASWFIPWAKEGWFPEALFNASAVMWSGIL